MLVPLVQESQQTTSMVPPYHAPPNIIQKQIPGPELLRGVGELVRSWIRWKVAIARRYARVSRSRRTRRYRLLTQVPEN